MLVREEIRHGDYRNTRTSGELSSLDEFTAWMSESPYNARTIPTHLSRMWIELHKKGSTAQGWADYTQVLLMPTVPPEMVRDGLGHATWPVPQIHEYAKVAVRYDGELTFISIPDPLPAEHGLAFAAALLAAIAWRASHTTLEDWEPAPF